jgi:hypothetical protein
MMPEDDDSPQITEQQSCECEDQFDDDLIRDLTERLDRKSERRPSCPQ